MKEKGVVLRIKKDRDWGEYQVQHWKDGKLDEAKTYHTDDELDAVNTIFHAHFNYPGSKISDSTGTARIIRKFVPQDSTGYAVYPDSKKSWKRMYSNRLDWQEKGLI